MATNDDAVLSVGGGHFWTCPYVSATPTPMPTDLSAPEAPWAEVGHTSLEDIFSISSEGGESTSLGTLQNRTLRTRIAPRTETFNFTLHEFDEAGLKLYYGSNAVVDTDGNVQVPSQPKPTICSFLAVFSDGTETFAFYAPKAEVLRSEDLSIADTDSLAGLPIGVKPVQHGSNSWLYKVTPMGTP